MLPHIQSVITVEIFGAIRFFLQWIPLLWRQILCGARHSMQSISNIALFIYVIMNLPFFHHHHFNGILIRISIFIFVETLFFFPFTQCIAACLALLIYRFVLLWIPSLMKNITHKKCPRLGFYCNCFWLFRELRVIRVFASRLTLFVGFFLALVDSNAIMLPLILERWA